MRDIYPRSSGDPAPDRPPRPMPAAPRRRKAAAAALAALLTVALLFAGIGTIAAAVHGVAGASFSLPFSSLFASVSETYRRFAGTAGSTLALIGIGRDALALAPDLLQGRRGGEFLALLDRAQAELARVGDAAIPQLSFTGGELARAAGSFRAWLGAEETRTVILVFGNSAEMRAGGGFIGSYAEVRLRGGAVAGITVRDINEADAGSGDRTVPPVPLEPVADRWRAADANWFLSGPESGAAFLTLLNRTPLYRDDPADAAVFLAPRVVSELLSVTGPIAAGGVTVDSGNFLRAIQEEVQAGQAAGADAPKAILAELAPRFLSSVLSSAAAKPFQVADAIRGGVRRRDIVAYAADPAAQRALETLGLSASLYPTGEGFVGGYVAVAPSTIGGDKTDAVTTQEVRVREQLLASGLVETTVEVERRHGGTDEDPWWYREEHRSYVKVYAPEGATPTDAAGIWVRERTPARYGEGFVPYAPLQASVSTLRTYPGLPGIESYEETGKTVFGFWQRTARGQGTVAGVAYARQLARPLRAGDEYVFVLERQPASTAAYDVQLFAPPGLTFAESGTAQYAWRSDDPDGRTVLRLTLAPAP